MVAAGEHLRFPLEPGEAIGVCGEGVGEDLQRDVAAQSRVGCPIDLAHAALADEGGDVVMAESGADGEGHRLSGNPWDYRHSKPTPTSTGGMITRPCRTVQRGTPPRDPGHNEGS